MLNYIKDIKRSKLYIKLYRVDIMLSMSRMKKWEFYHINGNHPVWAMSQEKKLNEIWDSIMREIESIDNN